MATEKELLKTFLNPLKVCKRYKPRFGQGNKKEGVSLSRFLDLYSADPFYAWCGLNSERMYAAHKTAGGMTSVYRQTLGWQTPSSVMTKVINQYALSTVALDS